MHKFILSFNQEKKLDIIIHALNLHNDSVDYNSVRFEKDSDIELNSRPTSFDFYFKTNKNKNIHFEIKYTEQEFGKAKRDQKHFNKYERIYKNRCSVINSKYRNRDSFLNNYQLMRNLIHLSDNSYVVFIYPINNKKIKEQAEFAKSDFVKSKFQQNVINLTWEQLLGFVETNIKNSKDLILQVTDFKDKYKITPSR